MKTSAKLFPGLQNSAIDIVKMSSSTAPASTARTPAANIGGHRLGVLILTGAIIALIMAWRTIPPVWHWGYFGDTDDALRMVQVRDLIAGQNWFDMRIYRLHPPEGLLNHWSRVVDAPIAALAMGWGLLFEADFAERAARLSFSTLMFLLLLIAIARAADGLMGPGAAPPALVLAVLSGATLGQFQPGRIDHHAPQIVLLVFMFFFACRSLEPGKEKYAAWAAAVAALSLSISIENITFIASLSAFWIMLWAVKGSSVKDQLTMFGTGFLFALPIVYIGTIGPERWSSVYCDAFSLAIVTPFAMIAVLSLTFGKLNVEFGWRIAIVVGAFAVAVIILFSLFPHCRSGPLGALDPLLRSYWLENVQEARSLRSSLAAHFQYTLLTTGPIFVCVTFIGAAAAHSDGVRRLQWIMLAAMAIAGVATTIWQIRAASSLSALAILGGAWFILHIQRQLERRAVETAPILALGGAIFLSPMGWAVLHDLLFSPGSQAKASTRAAMNVHSDENCFHPLHYVRLANLPAGLVAAPIDSGAHILAHSHHSVLAAAYHRNNAGNRIVLDAFFATPEKARMIMSRHRANYIALCVHASERHLLERYAPHGFGMALFAGNSPHWLQEVSGPSDRLRVYRITDGADQ